MNRSVAYSASLVAFLLALLSKTQVVFLPVALLLCAWWRNSPVDSKRQGKGNPLRFQREIARTVPFFLIAIVLGLITIWFQNRGIGEEEIILGPFTRRLTNAGMAIWWYAKQVFAPIRLMVVYPQWRFDPPALADWLPLIALTGVTAAALAATLSRPSLCLRLFHHRAAAGDRICAHVIRTQRGAGGGSSAVLRRHFFDCAV